MAAIVVLEISIPIIHKSGVHCSKWWHLLEESLYEATSTSICSHQASQWSSSDYCDIQIHIWAVSQTKRKHQSKIYQDVKKAASRRKAARSSLNVVGRLHACDQLVMVIRIHQESWQGQRCDLWHAFTSEKVPIPECCKSMIQFLFSGLNSFSHIHTPRHSMVLPV